MRFFNAGVSVAVPHTPIYLFIGPRRPPPPPPPQTVVLPTVFRRYVYDRLERFSYIIRCVKKIYVRVRPNSRGTTGRFYIVTRIRETYYRARRDGSLVRVKDDKTEKKGFRPYRRARQDEFLGTRNDRRTVYVTNYYIVPRSRTLLRTRSAIRPCYVRSKCSKRSGRATKTHLQWVWDDGHAKTNTITALRNRRRRRKIIVDRDSRESVRGR